MSTKIAKKLQFIFYNNCDKVIFKRADQHEAEY